MVLKGMEYSDESISDSFDYFKEAYLTGAGKDYKVIFDVLDDNKQPFFWPEMAKIKADAKEEGCLEECSMNDKYAHHFQIDVAKDNAKKADDEELMKTIDDTLEFQEMFNDKYLDRIKNFVKSTSTYFRIGDYCAKVVKVIQFAEFFERKYRNMALSGELSDFYEGDELRPNSMGIHNGYRNNQLQTFITFDR